MLMRTRADPAADAQAVSADVLAAFLLDLYRLAREVPLAEFQGRVLERLKMALPFDGAWWGMVQLDRELHSSYLFGMPPEFIEYWSRIRDQDALADLVLREPGTTVNFTPRQIAADPAFGEFFKRFRIKQTLCTLLMNPTLKLATFLSLYRSKATPLFTVRERLFKQLVMPHLWAAWASNWIAELASARAHSFSSRVALAIADQKGVLHAAEPRFSVLIKQEWEQWIGPDLPKVLLAAMRTGEPVRAKRTLMRLHPVSGMYLVEAEAISPLACLTPRERTVADGFGRGRSYKEIAAALPISPATVRAHLRAIYSKLGISDKTELASLLSLHSELRDPHVFK